MSCTSCKEKKDIKNQMMETADFVSKGIVWFTVVWSALGLYGLYTLINNFL
jgi:hypothetical protein